MKIALSFFGIALLIFAISSTMIARMPEQDFKHITGAVKTSDLKKVKNFLALRTLHTLDSYQKMGLLEEATAMLAAYERILERKNKKTIIGKLITACGIVEGAVMAYTIYCHAKTKDSNGEEKGFKQTLLKDLPYTLLAPTEAYLPKAVFLTMLLGLGGGMYIVNRKSRSARIAAFCRNNAKRIRDLLVREFLEQAT